jgi:hypothetical protein
LFARKTSRKVEKWADIVTQLGLDLSTNRVTAKQIKQVLHEEPRLMAKMGTLDDLPRVFRDNNIFLLPANRHEYVLVRGKGYHDLEGMMHSKPTNFTTSFPFPLCQGSHCYTLYFDMRNRDSLY